MRPRVLSLAILNIRSTFSFNLPSRKELKQPKTLAKTVGIGIGILLLFADFTLIFVMNSQAMYSGFKPVGLEDMMLLYTATTAALLVFVFSFTMALSLFSASAVDSGFLVLPFKPHELLAAKMALVYFTNLLIGIFVLMVSAIVYGVNEHPPLLFYLYSLLSSLALPLIPLAISYLVLIPLMNTSGLFRNKNFIIYLGGFLGIGMALAFNLYIQGTMTRLQDPSFAMAFASPDSFLSRLGRAWIPSLLVWKALSQAGNFTGFLALAGNFALGALVVGAVVFLLGKPYLRSIQIFGESSFSRGRKRKRAQDGREYEEIKAPLASLLAREIRLMNREPIFFINGPFIVILLPVFMGIAFFAQRSSLKGMFSALEPLLGGPAGYLIPAALGGFLGSSTSIACTAVSRDAKTLSWIKALPVSAFEYFAAKLLHAEIFSVFGAVVGCAASWLVLGTGAADLALGFILALLFSTAFNMGGLWLDTANPRLRWDNPVAAMKQNPNAVIVILAAMGILAALGFLTFNVSLPRNVYALVYGLVFSGCILLWVLRYPKFAEKRYARFE
jgi:ABC-2 type transport system permease protein